MNIGEFADSEIVDIRSALSVRARGERVERVLALGVVLVLLLVIVLAWSALAANPYGAGGSDTSGSDSPSISVSSL